MAISASLYKSIYIFIKPADIRLCKYRLEEKKKQPPSYFIFTSSWPRGKVLSASSNLNADSGSTDGEFKGRKERCRQAVECIMMQVTTCSIHPVE